MNDVCWGGRRHERQRGGVVLIGPEGLIEIDVMSVQSRADVNRPHLLSVTI